MTLEIVVLDQKRTFAAADSMVTIDDCKTYDGEQKIFRISDRLSAILLLSGNSEFEGQKLKNLIDEYVSKTDFNQINSVEEIKETLNESITQSSKEINLEEYIETTFDDFEKRIKIQIEKYDTTNQKIEFLKLNSFDEDIDFLTRNKLLNLKIMKLTNSLFKIKNKDEFNIIKFYLIGNYINSIIKNSPNVVLVGYDENNDYPTYINYILLFNNNGKIEHIERYSLHNCESTMIISLAQDNYVDLVLTGFNDDTYIEIQDSVIELFNEFGSLKINDYSTLNSISEKLGMKIKEHKLNNLKDMMSYIKILPDSEIFKLLDALILLTSIKMKFSSKVHSVGGKRVKVILRKFEGITFIE